MKKLFAAVWPAVVWPCVILVVAFVLALTVRAVAQNYGPGGFKFDTLGALYQTGLKWASGTGTSAPYYDVYADTETVGSAIITATTTQLITGVANENIYLWFAGAEAAGTESAATFNYEYGTGANCATGTKTLAPVAVAGGAAAGNWAQEYSAGGTGPGLEPASVPYVIPAGNSVCVVTAGTTINLQPVTLYTLR